MQKLFKKQDGFTLLEVVAALVIVGILSAIVVSRMTNMDAEVYAGANTLKAHLRYAQAQAMNRDPNVGTNTIMGINYDSTSNQYWLFSGTNTSNIEVLPDDMQYTTSDRTIDLNEKNIKLGENFTIFFDDRGIPYQSYTSSTSNTLLSETTIAVSGLTGSRTINVTITPQTGYIP